MSIFKKVPPLLDTDDATLVLLVLGGDKDAFGQIVIRYQNLLCSLAYSSIGDIKQSEDLAQEVFVEAWKKLDSLLEPEKLKAWLCGILRYKVSHYRRKQQKQPLSTDEVETLDIEKLEHGKLEDSAMREQQHALLWQTLNKLDDSYREPLILYYREERSVEHVANQLDLTQDTVKQRLSRGRKMLQKSMQVIVEEVLENSKPSAIFTAAVLTTIGNIAPEAKAAVWGAGAAKTGSLFKLSTLVALLASFSGLISGFLGLRAGLDQSRTRRERRNTVKTAALFFAVALIYVLGMFVLRYFAMSAPANAPVLTWLSQALVFGFAICYVLMTYYLFKSARALRAQERINAPQAFTGEHNQPNAKQREYISSWTLLSVPLMHIRFGMQEQNDKPVFAWIAGGDVAHALLFAWGGVAIAPVSVGILSIGIFSVGALGVGVFAIGTVAMGLIAFGASAIGYKAYASLSSLGWESAFSNGFSVAKDAAIGQVAYAKHVNNELASHLSNLSLFDQSYLWVLAIMSVMVIIPAALYAKNVRKRMANK
ncbi:RNA polymerase sigma factor [Ningiella sp. W23]|uniref:RNA polymerase sigma factor n=1 Tax=Ningiella sp. W23 TaxID=3023715 RepID=UPI0037581ACA